MAKVTQNGDFVMKLTNAIRDAGQEIIDRAPDIAGKNPMLSNMTITISFDPEIGMCCPTIEVNKEYLCKRAIDRLNIWQPHYMGGPFKEEGENNDGQCSE